MPRPRLCVGVSSHVKRVRTPTQSRGRGTQHFAMNGLVEWIGRLSRRTPARDCRGVVQSVGSQLRAKQIPFFRRRQLQESRQIERSSVAQQSGFHHCRDVNRSITRIQPGFNAAIEPRESVQENRTPRRGGGHLKTREFVGVARRLQTESPHQFELRFVHKMRRKCPRGLDQLPRLMRLREAGDQTRHLGNDRRGTDKGRGESAPSPGMFGSDDPNLAFDAIEDGCGDRRLQNSLGR